jgi:antimicrobial peptide system SdpA family protein
MEDVDMDKQDRDVRRLRVLGSLVVCLTASWSILIMYIVHSALPFNPIHLPLEGALRVRYFAPEGWAFFTRDPREERFKAFVRTRDGVWSDALTSPHSRAANLFGLNRRSTAQGIEIGLLLTEIPEKAWQGCRGEISDCLPALAVSNSIQNVSPQPTLCGDVGISAQKPVPWAWSRSRTKIIMPSRLLRLKVLC